VHDKGYEDATHYRAPLNRLALMLGVAALASAALVNGAAEVLQKSLPPVFDPARSTEASIRVSISINMRAAPG
jgi:hypothetical protein